MSISALLREDGGHILREGGGLILREVSSMATRLETAWDNEWIIYMDNIEVARGPDMSDALESYRLALSPPVPPDVQEKIDIVDAAIAAL